MASNLLSNVPPYLSTMQLEYGGMVRDKNGRFVKGVRSSPATEFKKGQHWRKSKPYWSKDWLHSEYVVKGRSLGEIATEFNVTEPAIRFWARKHGIPMRTTSEARSIKCWGQSGCDNPMWNRRGELNPNWRGGVSQERQAFYSSVEWKSACSAVWKRDSARCRRCGLSKNESPDVPFHIHHIISFSNGDLRADVDNLVLLCEVCHHFVHSRRNVDGEFLSEI